MPVLERADPAAWSDHDRLRSVQTSLDRRRAHRQPLDRGTTAIGRFAYLTM
jgi:hypothetical protein